MTLRTLAVATLAASALGVALHAPAIVPTDSGSSSTYGQLHRGGSLGLLGRLDELSLSPASSSPLSLGCQIMTVWPMPERSLSPAGLN